MVYLGILGNRVAWVTFQRTSELSSELSSFQRTSEQIPFERELKLILQHIIMSLLDRFYVR